MDSFYFKLVYLEQSMVGNEDKKWEWLLIKGLYGLLQYGTWMDQGKVRKDWKQGNQVQSSCVARGDENQK